MTSLESCPPPQEWLLAILGVTSTPLPRNPGETHPPSSHRPSNSFKSCNKEHEKINIVCVWQPQEGGSSSARFQMTLEGKIRGQTPSSPLLVLVPPASHQHRLLSAQQIFLSFHSTGALEDTKLS